MVRMHNGGSISFRRALWNRKASDQPKVDPMLGTLFSAESNSALFPNGVARYREILNCVQETGPIESCVVAYAVVRSAFAKTMGPWSKAEKTESQLVRDEFARWQRHKIRKELANGSEPSTVWTGAAERADDRTWWRPKPVRPSLMFGSVRTGGSAQRRLGFARMRQVGWKPLNTMPQPRPKLNDRHCAMSDEIRTVT